MLNKFASYAAAAVLLCAGLTSCDSSSDSAIDRDLTRLGNCLDSVKAATPVYTAEAWDNIKTEYNKTIKDVEATGEKFSDAASKKLDNIKADYNKLKDDYTVHLKEADDKRTAESAGAPRLVLRKALFGDGEIGNDMKFGFVTAKNALSVYERFVNTVKENQNAYTREDWDEIKVLYEALDKRKNEIEKDLPTADNLKIAKLKVQFAAIKSVKRTEAKVEEKS